MTGRHRRSARGEAHRLEQSRLARPPTANLEAYDDYLRAVNSGARLDLSSALSFYKKAMLLDPTFADAYAAYARTAAYIWRNDFDDVLPGPVARKLAYEAASRALALDPDSPGSYSVLAVLQLVDQQYDEAIASARMAVSLGPSSAEAYIALGSRPCVRAENLRMPSPRSPPRSASTRNYRPATGSLPAGPFSSTAITP